MDIEKLVQTKYGFIIDTHYHLREHGVDAFILTKGKRLFVSFHLLDNPHLDRRYRFTLAEELAHHVIHHDIYKDCKTIDDRIEKESLLTRQEVHYLETNAKALASAILIPKSLIEPTIEIIFSALGTDAKNTGAIITTLSRDFDVSVSAMKRRLLNLGYHNRSNLTLK